MSDFLPARHSQALLPLILDFLDLSGHLRACAEERSVALDSLHPNVFGHHCIGRALARYTEAQVPSAAD